MFRFLVSRRFLSAIVAVVVSSLSLSACAQDQPIDFDRQIAPLIASRCLDCHGGEAPKGGLDLSHRERATLGGESGQAIVPGKPTSSLLWQQISADEMPPKHPLPPEEKSLIERWISEGAKWGADPIDPFRFTTTVRAGVDWWSLQSVLRPAPPEVKQAARVRNSIDRFIAAALETQGLPSSPEADRRVLIRRLSFDLVGLPPTPEEVETFVRDEGEGAYERLVDRLLDSPQYGVRWARHWLDVVRFGESNGFEYDEFRRHAWPYRDWVIRALNEDLPYDEFVRLQIAGDVLSPGNLDATIATGFLAAGAYDTAGQSQQSVAMRAVVRQDEMEDLVGTVGQTFLGLTVHCARCHDHKFDPVRQNEYYALVSALSGARQGDRDLAGCKTDGARGEQIARAESRRQEILAQIAAVEGPLRARIVEERVQRPVDLHPVAHWEFAGGGPSAAEKLALHGAARIDEEGLVLDGATSYASASCQADLHEKTLEVWVRPANLEQRGGAAVSVQTVGGGTFDAVVFAEAEPQRWMAGSDVFSRTQSFAGPVETETANSVHICISYSADGTITAYRNGQPYGKSYRASATARFPAKQSQVLFGLRHDPPGPGKFFAGTIERARLYDRALSADEVAASSGRYIPISALRERLAEDERARYDALKEQLVQAESALATLRPTRVYAINPQQPPATHLLARGNPAQEKELVAAGGLSALAGLPAEFGLAPDAPEAERRQRLAAWITDERNPLFARVMVNRLWHYHFGLGLVDTPNDFGFNGGRPTNAKLLDWLAAEFVARRYSLKSMHRLIVTSATYRQASRHDATAAAIDAENRLLWRKTSLRLEAEAVRDAMLHAAGVLNLTQGGPGFQEMKVDVAPGTSTYLYAPDDPTLDHFKRRTLYRVWARSGRNQLLDAFDCPDPSTTTPRRAMTTTPLQALSLLNNTFVLHVCEKFGERLVREAGPEPADQIDLAYRIAYGRRPAADERALAVDVARRHGTTVLARAIFNSSEFLYVD